MKPISLIDLLLYVALGALSLFILFGHMFLPHGHTEGNEHASVLNHGYTQASLLSS